MHDAEHHRQQQTDRCQRGGGQRRKGSSTIATAAKRSDTKAIGGIIVTPALATAKFTPQTSGDDDQADQVEQRHVRRRCSLGICNGAGAAECCPPDGRETSGKNAWRPSGNAGLAAHLSGDPALLRTRS